MNELDTVLRKCLAVLDSLRIPHAVIGGLAVGIYGIPRPACNLDLLISLPREQIPELFHGLTAAGFDVPEAYRGGWVDEVAGLPLVKS